MEAANPQDGSAAWQGVWIAIPAYQEAATIRALAQAALAQSPNVMVVDDGSSDGTGGQLQGLPVTLLKHAHNRGKAASLRTAFAHALAQGAQCVIAMDGDGQHDPADAPLLLAVWRRQPQRIVIGSRLHDRSQFPLARWRANRFACFWISWAAGHAIADSQSGFRAYPAAVMRLALGRGVRGSRFTFESEVLIESARHGHPTLAIAIAGRYPANARPSHFRPVWDITKIVLMVAGRLLRSGMAPLGLWRSLAPAPVLPGRELPTPTPARHATGRGARACGAEGPRRPAAMKDGSVAVAAQGLVFRYAGQDSPALAGVSLLMRRGQATGLLGPNGSGKSTLLSLLAGLRVAQQGSITRAADGPHDLAWVPQEYAFYLDLTCLENLRFFARMLRLPPADAGRRIEAAIASCRLGEFGARRARHCSGGVRRRLNLAIALLQAPEVLLLDEPTAGVDPQSRAFLLERVRELVAGGTAVLYATHYMEEVSAVCSDIVLLDHGQVLAAGDLATLLRGPEGEPAHANLEALFMHHTRRSLRD